MSTYGLSGSATYSQTLSGLDEMMSVIPDNISNQITARNVRDVVFTLYEDLQTFSSSTVTSLSASNIFFGNVNPTLIPVGGIPSGYSFNVSTTVFDVLNKMLYPYTQPILTLTTSPSLLEYGNTGSIILNWTLTKKSNIISTVNINTPNGNVFPPPYAPSTTNVTTSGSYTIIPLLNTLNIYTFSVNDSSTITSLTASLDWRNRRYWGTIDLTSIGNTNLTLYPGSASYVGSYFSGLGSSFILSSDGAGSGSSSEFANVYSSTKIYNANGKYIYWAWPSSFGTPTQFLVNGLLNNAFTKILNNYVFTNTYGYTASYDIWITNTTLGNINTTIQII